MSGIRIKTFLLLILIYIPLASAIAQKSNLKSLNSSEVQGVVKRSSNKNRVPLEVDVVRLFSSDDRTRSLFDDYYVGNIQRIAEQANIEERSWDFDEDKAAKAGQRALTMRLSDSVHKTILGSELRTHYKIAVREVVRVRRKINYSLQHTGEALAVSNKRKGKKLVEFDLEPNFKSGAAAIFRILDVGQVKVEPAEGSVMFEYRRGW